MPDIKIYETEIEVKDLLAQIDTDKLLSFPWTENIPSNKNKLTAYIYPVLHGSGFPIKPEYIRSIQGLQAKNDRVSGFIKDPVTGNQLKVITKFAWLKNINWTDRNGNALSIEQRKRYPFQNNGNDGKYIVIDDVIFYRCSSTKLKSVVSKRKLNNKQGTPTALSSAPNSVAQPENFQTGSFNEIVQLNNNTVTSESIPHSYTDNTNLQNNPEMRQVNGGEIYLPTQPLSTTLYETEIEIKDLLAPIDTHKLLSFPWTWNMPKNNNKLTAYIYPVLHGSGFPIKPEYIPSIQVSQAKNERVSGFIENPATKEKLKVITKYAWLENINWTDRNGNALSIEQRKRYPFQNNGNDGKYIVIDDVIFYRCSSTKLKTVVSKRKLNNKQGTPTALSSAPNSVAQPESFQTGSFNEIAQLNNNTVTTESAADASNNGVVQLQAEFNAGLDELTSDLPISELIEEAKKLPDYAAVVTKWLGPNFKETERWRFTEARYPVLMGCGLPIRPTYISKLINLSGVDYFRMGTLDYSFPNQLNKTIVVVSMHRWCKDLAWIDANDNELLPEQRKQLNFLNNEKDGNFLNYYGIAYFRKREKVNIRNKAKTARKRNADNISDVATFPAIQQAAIPVKLNILNIPYATANSYQEPELPLSADPITTDFMATSTTSLSLADFYVNPADASNAGEIGPENNLELACDGVTFVNNPLFTHDTDSALHDPFNDVPDDNEMNFLSDAELQGEQLFTTWDHNGLLHTDWATVLGINTSVTNNAQLEPPIPVLNNPAQFFYQSNITPVNSQFSRISKIDFSQEQPSEFSQQDTVPNKRRKF